MRTFCWPLSLSAVLAPALAFFLSSEVGAQVPVTKYVVIQPIDVCSSSGPTGGCAPFNNISQSPDPSKATATTPIGFVDPTTNVNLTRAIWLQTGIDVTFLPIVGYNNSNYQVLNISCSTANNPCTGTLASDAFKQLSTGGTSVIKGTGCKTNCTDPVGKAAPFPNANAINMFFVNSLFPVSPLTGTLYGFGWLNSNGIAIAANTFSFSSAPSRWDTLAHEIGHNLNLDHNTFGAGAANNALTAGSGRALASSTGCTAATTTSTGGQLYDFASGACSVMAATPIADALILGNSTNTQQGQALISGFMNPIPNVSATAGGGAPAVTAATTTTLTSTATSSAITAPAATSTAVNFTVTYPKLKTAGGRSGQYIFSLVLALPQGFQFGPNLFTQTGGSAQVFSFEQLNGNNGQGNLNCLKPLNGGPSIQCLEIDFVPGTFTQNTSISFSLDIINKSTGQPAALSDLACSLPNPQACFDLTYVFSDLLATSSALNFRDKTGNLSANSQLPDLGVASTIVDPSNFPSVANLNPPLTVTGFTQNGCTLSTQTTCPPPTKGGAPNPIAGVSYD